ncbi:hypothetical protein PMAYCL1PPCAC_15526, partial [Pristionchus mayeri]
PHPGDTMVRLLFSLIVLFCLLHPLIEAAPSSPRKFETFDGSDAFFFDSEIGSFPSKRGMDYSGLIMRNFPMLRRV